jgi:hypothetical protein
MDYSNYALESSLYERQVLNSLIVEQMRKESELFLISLESSLINIDQLDIVREGFIDTIKDFFRRIIEFLKNLFTNHKKKTETIIKNYNDYKNNNADAIKNLKSGNSTASIKMAPYWNGDKALNDSFNMCNKLIETFLDVEGAKENDPVVKNHADKNTIYQNDPIIKEFVTKETDLANNLKNYFRSGNISKTLEHENINPAGIARVVTDMTEYCDGYEANYVNKFNAIQKKFEDFAKKSINEAERVNVKECFSFLENSLLVDGLGHTLNSFVLEAAPNQPEVNKPATTNQQDNKPATPQPAQTNANQDNTNKKPQGAEVSKTDKTEDKKTGNDKLKAMQNLNEIIKLVLTTAMSIAEEKFIYYLNTLKMLK